ncbi:MAG TPA: hypothetical protein VMG82_12075, partial [Candidatus Sulfotelmatobacter sp.]|nr:hypothetical protein [Candidatus Sulfotelmatobacter sp.]
DLSLQEIDELVRSLNSLSEGELGISMLVACGERAVPALRSFLLYGRPSGIFTPRQRAVRALAELGAKDTLLEYLTADLPSPDPVIAHGEEAVKNTAARSLASWKTDDVFYALLNVLERHRLTGAIEALGEFQRAEAVPALVLTLEDAFCRSFAEDALLKIGVPARTALIDAARTPDPSGSNESATSRSRRRSALRLLQNLEFTARDWPLLAALLYDRNAEIAARTGMIALKFGNEQEQKIATRRLIQALSTADWLLQGEIESSLDEHFDIAHSFICAEIERRRMREFGAQSLDNILRLLLAIVDRHAPRKVV